MNKAGTRCQAMTQDHTQCILLAGPQARMVAWEDGTYEAVSVCNVHGRSEKLRVWRKRA